MPESNKADADKTAAEHAAEVTAGLFGLPAAVSTAVTTSVTTVPETALPTALGALVLGVGAVVLGAEVAVILGAMVLGGVLGQLVSHVSVKKK